MAVIFPIISTFDAAGVNKAQRAFKGLSGTTKTAAIAFGALGIAATKFGMDAVKAAAADEKAQVKLAKTLQNVTGATARQIAATEKFITTQQFATGVSDTQLRPALETLVRATGDVTKAQGLLKLGLDVSAGSGRDLESISLALAKAQGGQFTALQRLGIVIPDTIKKSKDFGAVQEYLNKLFGGQAAAAANTYEGKLAIMRERLGEVKETIGGALIPTLTGFADKIIKDVLPSVEVFVNALVGNTSVASSLSESQQTALKWGNIIRAVIQTVVNYTPYLVAFGGVLVATFAIAKIAAAAGAIIKIIQGIIFVYEGLILVASGASVATAFATGGVSVAAGAAGAAAAVGAMAVAFVAVNAAVNKYKQNTKSLPSIEIAPDGVLADAKVYKDVVIPGLENTAKSGSKAGKGLKTVGDSAKGAKALVSAFTEELSKANGVLESARQAYKNYKESVADSIRGILNFGSAQDASTSTAIKAQEAQDELRRAQATYNDSLSTGNIELQQTALESLRKAEEDAAASITGRKSFIQVLQDQAALASTFAGKVQTLISMGLSESAIGQVLSAGADAGSAIADEIIAGGATVVDQVNTLITATQSVADAIGESAASQFYSAGVTAGQSLVDGVKAAIAAAGFTVAVGATGAETVVNQAGLDQVNAEIAKAKTKKSKGGKKITDKERQNIMDLAASLGVEVPAFAKGGIVTKPTLALIGEAGPEAVVPLNRNNTPTGLTINLTVNAGMGADGAVIGREIVDIIKRYERISGPVFASA